MHLYLHRNNTYGIREKYTIEERKQLVVLNNLMANNYFGIYCLYPIVSIAPFQNSKKHPQPSIVVTGVLTANRLAYLRLHCT